MREEDLYNLSDDDLDKAFAEAKASLDSPITDIEDNYTEENVEMDVEDNEPLELDKPEEAESDDDLDGTDSVIDNAEADSDTNPEGLDGVTDGETEQTDEVDDIDIPQTTEIQKLKFKANGKEYELTEAEMRDMFPKVFGQAMDYTRKTQAMKPWRKTIDAIEQAKLSHDQINLMIDVFKGDKNAIAEVIKRTGVDALDLDTENSRYEPKDYGRDDATLAIKDVVDEISADKEYEITHKILSKEWDERSFKEFTKDPEMIRLLHIDVKSGTYDKVQPIAEKLKVFDGGRQTDLDYYKLAANEYVKEQLEIQRRLQASEQQRLAREAKLSKQTELDRVKVAQQSRERVVEKVEQRKAAAPVKSNAGTKKNIDFLEDSDEAFEEWYRKVEASR